MSHPYRALIHRDTKPAIGGRTLVGRLRSARRWWLVCRGGRWRSRWKRCKDCRLATLPRGDDWSTLCDRCRAVRMFAPRPKHTAPDVLPEIPDLQFFALPRGTQKGIVRAIASVRVPDGETKKVKV